MTMGRSILAYVAVSPRGLIMSYTVSSTPEKVLERLRSLNNPDPIRRGWHVCRVYGTVGERIDP